MNAERPSNAVLHVAGWAWTLGGLQSVVRHHVERDAALGYTPRVISLFDRVAPAGQSGRVGARAWTWVGVARRRFRRLAAECPRALAIYHDGWGLPWWADCDGASRRVLYLHTEVPHLEAKLRLAAPRIDAVFSISHSMIDRLRKAVPEFPAERCFYLPYFVSAPPLPVALDRPRVGPWRVGYAGRLERAHKRVERLPALVAALERTGLDFRFEMLGAGTEEARLRREMGGNPRVEFFGRKSGIDYWRTLAGWDCLVLPSDFEGFSRVTMEGMMVGVLPVVPAYSAAAGEMVGPVGEAGIYPTGDMTAAAQRIVAHARQPRAQVITWREAMLAHLADHTVEKYEEAYLAAITRVRDLSAASACSHSSPQFWATMLPLGLHTRLWPERF